MNFAMSLPEAVRRARNELGLSPAALASLAGLQRNSVCALENGGNVTIETVRRVLRHLPNLQTFILETAIVEVRAIRSEPWNQGAVAAATFIEKACRHVIDRVGGGEQSKI